MMIIEGIAAIHENVFENVVCKVAAILCWH